MERNPMITSALFGVIVFIITLLILALTNQRVINVQKVNKNGKTTKNWSKVVLIAIIFGLLISINTFLLGCTFEIKSKPHVVHTMKFSNTY